MIVCCLQFEIRIVWSNLCAFFARTSVLSFVLRDNLQFWETILPTHRKFKATFFRIFRFAQYTSLLKHAADEPWRAYVIVHELWRAYVILFTPCPVSCRSSSYRGSLPSVSSPVTPDMQTLREGVKNMAGRLSSMASDMYNSIPVSTATVLYLNFVTTLSSQQRAVLVSCPR